MNTETNQLNEAGSSFWKFALFLERKGSEPLNPNFSDTRLRDAAEFVVQDLATFMETVELFPAHDYRSVDVGILKWCVEMGKLDAISALTEEALPGTLTANSAVSDALQRLRTRDKGFYIWHKSGVACGVNDDYFPDY